MKAERLAEWRDARHEVPPENECVLVCWSATPGEYPEAAPTIAYVRKDGKWVDWSDEHEIHVIAWLPLPEVPDATLDICPDHDPDGCNNCNEGAVWALEEENDEVR